MVQLGSESEQGERKQTASETDLGGNQVRPGGTQNQEEHQTQTALPTGSTHVLSLYYRWENHLAQKGLAIIKDRL